MMAYTMLELHKDVLRGFSMVPGLYMIVRLVMYTTSEGNTYNSAEWPMHLAIMACSMVGSLSGSRMRKYVDSAAILRILLVIVFVSSALMLGVVRKPMVALGYGILVTTWLTGLLALWYSPALLHTMQRLLARLKALLPFHSRQRGAPTHAVKTPASRGATTRASVAGIDAPISDSGK